MIINDSSFLDIVLNGYANCKYQDVANAIEELIKATEGDKTLLYVDLGHVLCLYGDYKKAARVLLDAIKVLEVGCYDNSVLEDAYLSYSICLLNLDDYCRYCYYISRFMEIIKDTDPETYMCLIDII